MNLTDIKKRCEARKNEPAHFGQALASALDVEGLVAWVERAAKALEFDARSKYREDARMLLTELDGEG